MGGEKLLYENQVEVLNRLGLTPNQTRIYLALSKLETATASQISKLSDLAREEIYRTIPRLQELSLVEIIVDTPTQYKATPLKDGISILLNRKTEESNLLVEDTREILKSIDNSGAKFQIPEEKSFKFTLLPKNEVNIQKRKQSILNTRNTLDGISSYTRLNQCINFGISEAMNTILDRGVKVRTILQKPESQSQIDFLKRFAHPNREIRYCLTKPPVYVAICDDQNVFISTESESNLKNETCLWTDNACLVKLARTHFETVWREALIRESVDVLVSQFR